MEVSSLSVKEGSSIYQMNHIRDPAGGIYGETSVEGVVGAASPPLGRAVYHGVCTAKWVIVKRDVTTRGQRMVCGPSSLYL